MQLFIGYLSSDAKLNAFTFSCAYVYIYTKTLRLRLADAGKFETNDFQDLQSTVYDVVYIEVLALA